MMSHHQTLAAIDDALAEVLRHAIPSVKCERVELGQALGKTLSEDIFSTINVPTENNSAMDGYAVNVDDLIKTNELAISQRIAAGQAASPLQAGTCARIFTGAPIPSGANAVVMQEACELIDTRVKFPANIDVGNNIRLAGSDITQGSCVLRKGHRLAPQDLGLLASVGVQSVNVIAPIKVAILATGLN